MSENTVLESILRRELDRQRRMKQTYEERKAKVSDFEGVRMSISRKRNKDYYYLVKDDGLEYLGNEKNETVQAIKEFRLCEKMLQITETNIYALKKFLKKYQWITPQLIQEKMPKTYLPLNLNENFEDKRFNKNWQRKMNAIKKSYPVKRPENLIAETCDGTRVRSRAEALLYDMFVAMGFVVLYEFPVVINGITYCPDFLLMNPRTHKLYIWEHLGMWYHETRGPSYRQEFIQKTMQYAQIGFSLGYNLLTSYESPGGGIYLNPLQELCRSILENTNNDENGVDAIKFYKEIASKRREA